MPVSISGSFTTSLTSDLDSDGVADPGDGLSGELIITNSGDAPATDVIATLTENGMTIDPGSVRIGPIAFHDALPSVTGNTPATFTAAQLLGNDVDPDDATPNLTITTINGTAVVDGNGDPINVTVAVTGGTIEAELDGTFTFRPTTGFEGAAGFTYDVVDADGVASVTPAANNVSFTVTDPVWYVDSTGGSDVTGDGSYENPFASLAPISTGGSSDALDDSNDTVFVYANGSNAYNSGIVLEQGQVLRGEGGGAFSVNGIGVSAGGADTQIEYSSFGAQLSSGNTITGIDFVGENNAAVAIVDGNASVGTLTVSNVEVSGLGQIIDVDQGGTLSVSLESAATTGSTGGNGGVIDVSGVSGTFTVSGATSITGAHSQAGIDISGNAGLTANFEGNVTANLGGQTAISIGSNSGGSDFNFTGQTIAVTTTSGAGVNLTGNSGSTIDFALSGGGNGLDIVTTTGTGFNATGGGTVTVSDPTDAASNSINAGNGTAINVNAVNIGAADMTFQSISSSGGTAAGIVLINTGTSGGLTVTGFDGADAGSLPDAGSGGTIANKTGANAWTVPGGVPTLTGTTDGVGIYMSNTHHTSISGVQLNDFNNAAIMSFNSTNFALSDSVVNGTNGNDAAVDESALYFFNLTGTGSITRGTYSGGFENNLQVLNTSGVLNRFTVDGATFGFNNTTNGNNNILIESRNAGTVLNFTIENSQIHGARADWLNASANSSSTMDIKVLGNNFDNLGAEAHAGAAAGGNRLVLGSVGTMTFDIDGNTFIGSLGEAIRVRSTATGTTTGDAVGYVRNNTIGNAAIANSGSREGSGIFLFGDGGSDMNAVIDNNDVFQYNNHGISITFGDEINNTSRFYATVKNNFVGSPGSLNTDFNGFHLNNGSVLATDNFTTTLDMFNNDFRNSGSGAISPNNNDVRLRHRQTTTVELPGYGGPAKDAADQDVEQVDTYLAGRGNLFNSATANNATGGGGYINGVAPPVIPFAILAATSPPVAPEQTLGDPEPEQDVLPDPVDHDDGAGTTPTPAPSPAPTDPSPSSEPIANEGALDAAGLALLVEAAIDRWIDAGATPQQVAAMRAATFSIADMAGAYLGSSSAGSVSVDSDGAGYGWFVDATPDDDSEFHGSGTLLTADVGGEAAGEIDLLTVLMHELGHQAGLEDFYSPTDAQEVMFGYAHLGERRLPGADDLAGADLSHVGHESFALAATTIATLPAGAAVRILFDFAVNSFNNQLIGPFSNWADIAFNPGGGTQASNSVPLAVDTLTIGNLVFLDANKDGDFDSATESGISGVAISLFADANNDNVADGAAIATTTTSALGLYSFTGLAEGNYIVSVDASNFNAGAPLEALLSSNGGGDPDDNVDSDDNGVPGTGSTVVSTSVTLNYNSEPTPGTGNDTNPTVDFAFRQNQTPVGLDDSFTTDEATSITSGSLFADNGSGADNDDDPLVVAAVNGSGASVGTQITLASGALLTVNSDGTFAYDPNGAFDEIPTVASGASNTPGTDNFTYTLAGGGTATVTVTINGLDNDDLLVGTPGDDNLNGQAGSDIVQGLGGNDYLRGSIDNDVLEGGEGNDQLLGDLGADQMTGGIGDDSYFVDSALDTIAEADGEGNDALRARADYVLAAGVSVETMHIDGAGAVNLTGNELAQTISGNGSANVLSGGGGDDNLNGQGGDDTVNGGSNNDYLRGSTGNDILNGGDGDDQLLGDLGVDQMSGGIGNDSYLVDNALDTIVEAGGEGNDAVRARADYVLAAGVSVETMHIDGAGAVNLTGNELVQAMVGSAGANILRGGGGNDHMFGLGGADTLHGGQGYDAIRGGADADSFVFDTALVSYDLILDFSVADDSIVLDQTIFGVLALGGLSAEAFHTGSSAHDGDDRIIYDSSNGNIYYDADGDGGGAQQLFVQLTPSLAVTNADFLIVA